MPQVYDRVLSCFAKGLGYPEDFFAAVCPPSYLPSHDLYQCCKPALCAAWKLCCVCALEGHRKSCAAVLEHRATVAAAMSVLRLSLVFADFQPERLRQLQRVRGQLLPQDCGH